MTEKEGVRGQMVLDTTSGGRGKLSGSSRHGDQKRSEVMIFIASQRGE